MAPVQINLLTFDVEDYYQILYRNLFDRKIEPSEEVVRCTDLILDTLSVYSVKATFFVLGIVAAKYPALVRRIADDGHEIASHGYAHIYVNLVSRGEFRNDLEASKKVLEDLSGKPVVGFRAPEFSIDATTPWAFEVIAELGFKYDSSLFPAKGKRYGDAKIPQRPYDVYTPSGVVREVPLSTVTLLNRRIPAAGGGYLRVFPFKFSIWAIRRMNQEGRAAVVYMHPYEFAARPLPIHYNGCGKTAFWTFLIEHRKQLLNRRLSLAKLRNLVQTFRFMPVAEFTDLER